MRVFEIHSKLYRGRGLFHNISFGKRCGATRISTLLGQSRAGLTLDPAGDLSIPTPLSMTIRIIDVGDTYVAPSCASQMQFPAWASMHRPG